MKEIKVSVNGLLAGDVLQVVTNLGTTPLLKAETAGNYNSTYLMTTAGFARIEVLRAFIPGVPHLPALISNPIYFDAA